MKEKSLLKYLHKNFINMFQDLSSKDKEKMKSQIANVLTLVRGILAPILMIISLCINSIEMSLIVIFLTVLTDSFDGWYARKNGYVSEFGALLDAICDKVFTFCVILPLIKINIPLFIVVIFIEILISLINSYLKIKNKKSSSRLLGKIKTFILDTTFVICYASLIFNIKAYIIKLFLIITIIFQLIALIDYIIRFNREIKNEKKIIIEKFANIFWIFMIGNLLGVLVEGVWYCLMHNGWETHVVTIWGPFCLIYGIGFSVLYIFGKMLKDKNLFIKFISIALLMDLVELAGGLILEFGLGMRAWNYSNQFLNIRGHISLKMTIIWGIAGILFARFLIPLWDKIWQRLRKIAMSKIGVGLTYIVTIFMIVNILFTSVCLVRWSNRHHRINTNNSVMLFIDKHYDDKFMQNRFIEWYFIDKK